MTASRPLIALIAAMARHRVIGINNSLPWHLPNDMKWFRRHTLGKPIIMGRKTFESFGGKPLPQRTNIVITRDPNYQAADCVVVNTIEAAVQAAGDVEEIMIIGGASFYAQMLPQAQRMYLTYVDAEIEGDAWFPEFAATEWREVSREHHAADDKNAYGHDFVILERI